MRKKEGERDWERTGRREKPTGTENKRRENSTKLWNFRKQMTVVTNRHTWASWNRSWPFRKSRCCLIHNAELPKGLGTGTTRCFGTVSKTGVKNSRVGTSLVVEWLRICLAMQGTWVWSLAQELRSNIPQSNEVHTPHLRPDSAKSLKTTTITKTQQGWLKVCLEIQHWIPVLTHASGNVSFSSCED